MRKDASYYIETLGRGFIVLSCMAACNEIVSYHVTPYKGGTGTRLLCNIGGLSTGFVVGKAVAKKVTSSIKKAIAAYNGEEIIDG